MVARGVDSRAPFRLSALPGRHSTCSAELQVMQCPQSASTPTAPAQPTCSGPTCMTSGLGGLVDASVCSGDTGFVKPHRSTFELSPREARRYAPERRSSWSATSAQNDCAGAKAARHDDRAQAQRPSRRTPCPDADYTIHDLGELLDLPLFGRSDRASAAESLTPHDDENADRY